MPATAPVVGVSTVPPSEPVQFGAPVAPAVAKAPTSMRLWNARHGVPIAAVFAADDGSAAVTIDESNHARLWPSIDGKREPWVVPLTVPVSVAVAHDGDGFALAALDDSGGMEVATISADGLFTSRVKQPPEPGYDAAIVNAAGFLVLRRDQTLQQLDVKGAVTATLQPPAGEHVMKLLHRGGRTLTIVRTRDGLRGHWLAADSLAWADQTPKLTVDLKRVFLSPDHERLLSFSSSRGEAVLVDLATGKAQPFASPNGPDGGSLGLPIGFSADRRVIMGFNDFELSTLEWWTFAGNKNAVLGGTSYDLEFVSVDAGVATDKNVITFSGHELVVAMPNNVRAPSTARFLGYRSPRVKAVKGSPLGAIATVGSSASLLDEQLHVAARLPALDTIPLATDLALIKLTVNDSAEPAVSLSAGIDPEWLEEPARNPKLKRSRPHIALFDVTAKKELQQWPTANAIRFEPATQLMAIDRGSKVMFARFDAAARKFVDEHTVAAPVTDVVLLDPAIADGNVAMLVRARGDRVELRTLRDVAAALPDAVTLTGSLEAIDRAGRIYLRVDPDTVVVHGLGAETRITGLTGWKLRPDPTGSQIAAVGKSRLMLLDERGQPVWSVGFPGVSNATWTADGALVVLAGDLARVDLATGRVVAAQCGWSFRLRTYRPDEVEIPSTTETLCDR